jgi:fermentation-respiration switch protein FrsA (DUF1100 family)
MISKRFLIRAGWAAISLVILFYAGAVAYVKVRETELIYPRDVAPEGLPAPADSLRLPYRSVDFHTADSVRLNAWIIPASHADSSGMWVLLCHGQSGHVSTTTRPQYYADLRTIGVNILAFDWRGFGASAGSPSEEGLYRDAKAAYDYLTVDLKVRPEQIIIFGHSLGTAPAIELATRVPAAGLVVEGAPTSVRNRGQEVYPLLPIKLIARSDFNSIGRIRRITMPKLFMHARADARIPFTHAQALMAEAKEPKRLIELGGGHADAFLADSARYFGEYARFVAEVAPKR